MKELDAKHARGGGCAASLTGNASGMALPELRAELHKEWAACLLHTGSIGGVEA